MLAVLQEAAEKAPSRVWKAAFGQMLLVVLEALSDVEVSVVHFSETIVILLF